MAEAVAAAVPRERPILFSGALVRAILAGTKSQTRRVVKNPDRLNGLMLQGEEPDWCPYGKPGDRLWVRETWSTGVACKCASCRSFSNEPGGVKYRATWCGESYVDRWHPSIHMPRKFSRITLEVTGVRVERLHEITSEDIAAEGITCRAHERCGIGCAGRRYAFYDKWNELHGADAAAKDPFVWVIDFRRL